jgi:predicted amidophosphoribosyltransferase
MRWSPTVHISSLRRRIANGDSVAGAIQRHLAVPFRFPGFDLVKTDIELRGLNRAERHAAISGAFTITEGASFAGRSVLVFDDVITSGATMKGAARTRRRSGASDVYGIALSHTEG